MVLPDGLRRGQCGKSVSDCAAQVCRWETEEHSLVDGQHFADYIGMFDVPKSQLAFEAADGGQVRYLSIRPKRDEVIETIELVKPDHHTAPLVVAMTLEVPGSHVDAEGHEDD